MSVPGIVASAVVPAGLPIITGLSSTNISESVATLNATVDANGSGATTTITFQWKYNSDNFSTGTIYSSVASTTHIGSESFYVNISGLLVNDSGQAETVGDGPGNDRWYWRVVATNYSGTTTSAVEEFRTWSKKTWDSDTSGSYTLTVPTVTPTGGTARARSIHYILLIGGGASHGSYPYAGGGGQFTEIREMQVSGDLSIVVGRGGSEIGDCYLGCFGVNGEGSSITGLASNVSVVGGSTQPLLNYANGVRSGSSGSGNPGGLSACVDTSQKFIIGAFGGGGGQNSWGGDGSCSGGSYYGGIPGLGHRNYYGVTCCFGGGGYANAGGNGGAKTIETYYAGRAPWFFPAGVGSSAGNGGDGTDYSFVAVSYSGRVIFQYYGP